MYPNMRSYDFLCKNIFNLFYINYHFPHFKLIHLDQTSLYSYLIKLDHIKITRIFIYLKIYFYHNLFTK